MLSAPSDGTWRAFVGRWDDNPAAISGVRLDQPSLTWEQARSVLTRELESYQSDDECPHCRRQAEDVLDGLAKLAPETPFEDSVDGDDYVLMPTFSGPVTNT